MEIQELLDRRLLMPNADAYANDAAAVATVAASVSFIAPLDDMIVGYYILYPSNDESNETTINVI